MPLLANPPATAGFILPYAIVPFDFDTPLLPAANVGFLLPAQPVGYLPTPPIIASCLKADFVIP